MWKMNQCEKAIIIMHVLYINCFNMYIYLCTVVYIYNMHVFDYRDTVMRLLASLDPEGTQQRRKKRLRRRVYINKV